MSIPSCILLDDKQIELYTKWLSRQDLIEDFEDCSCSSPVTWTIIDSGLGPSIVVTYCGQHSLHLEYDDDGDLVAKFTNPELFALPMPPCSICGKQSENSCEAPCSECGSD